MMPAASYLQGKIMNTQFKRRDALKIMAAFGGLFATQSVSLGAISAKNKQKVVSTWSYQGQPCLIFQQGAMLLLVNEIGSIGSAKWIDANTILVLSGSGWDAGLTGQFSADGRSVAWSNKTVWTQAPALLTIKNISGGWSYSDQPCAIFQQDRLLIAVNEVGSIGVCAWIFSDQIVVIGGAGWDLGLTGQVSNSGNTINWSNNTVWIRG